MHPEVRLIGDIPPLHRPLLITAFDGRNGAAAVAALAYLAEQWDAQPVAEIEIDRHFDFTVERPCVRTEDGVRVIDWPDAHFAVARPPGADRDVVLFVGDEPHLRWSAYSAAFASVAEALGIEQTMLLNAYQGGAAHTRPIPIHLVGADEEMTERFALPSRAPRYQGPASFAMALAVQERAQGRGGFSLTVTAPFYVVGDANPYGMRALVRALDGALGTSTDLEPIDGLIAEAEIGLIDAFEEQPDLRSTVRQLEEQYDLAIPLEETSRPADAVDPHAVVDEVEAFLRSLRVAPDSDPAEGGAPESGDGHLV